MPTDTTPKTEPRDYVVGKRERIDGADVLRIVGITKATSAERAKDDLRNGEGGRWVALPTNNWNEEELVVEQRDPITRRQRVEPGAQLTSTAAQNNWNEADPADAIDELASEIPPER